jgi:hypothetical protein
VAWAAPSPTGVFTVRERSAGDLGAFHLIHQRRDEGTCLPLPPWDPEPVSIRVRVTGH